MNEIWYKIRNFTYVRKKRIQFTYSMKTEHLFLTFEFVFLR